MRKIKLPLEKKEIAKLKIGDEVALNGIVYTARDQAHRRIVKLMKNGRPLPFDLRGETIYYTGPTPPCDGAVIGTSTALSADGERSRTIGSCGPTTSARMDKFTPALLKGGLRGMIGKGRRSEEIRRAIKKYNAVYFLALGGAGALLSGYVKSNELIAFSDLGPEAIYRLEVKNFPVIVGIDTKGRDIYEG